MKKHILFCVAVLLILAGSCKKSVDLGAKFEVRFDDMTRGYTLYYNEEGVLRNQYCYSIGFDTNFIIVKTSAVPQSDKVREDLDFHYYLINKAEYINLYAKPINSGLMGPFGKDEFYTLKEGNVRTANLDFSHDFNNEPIITY